MTFDELKKKERKQYKRANKWANKGDTIGLDNKICINPMYWCRRHEVFLSESDVERRHCLNKLSFDMRGYYSCSCLQNLEGI